MASPTNASATRMSPISASRSWLFTAGHDHARIEAALAAGPDVLVVDLEEFTPASHRQQTCAEFAEIKACCERQHCLAAVRINQLDNGGEQELAWLMPAGPAVVFLPQVESVEHIERLDRLLTEHELRLGLPVGSTLLIPTLESRTGLNHAAEILLASGRLQAALLGSGDLAADLGLERANRASGLVAWRSRFLNTCQRANCVAIDGPWPEAEGFVEDQDWARRQGFHARCVVDPRQIAPLHHALGHNSQDTTNKENTP
ncbi:HpcH/HpaI aldolase/citrate lyase family protein [Halomonas huangheensis]|uniref:HpcH/HpaI aldolase/citrate lyase domain-containing protein n=1 Tax=Halomonas huangheensis TaxID=1178482 RepID=W1N5V1_9GAMM|nr:aldolase/citrate lyase family protein [Halomonas huangheensis]ALM54318.1 hypothetical protein AR456_20115 [Halomonas huangheensis]ERL50874.1 hypothetical protein BJB45_19955 [Halomonas huangheensis]